MATEKVDNDEPVSRFWSKLNLVSEITAIIAGNPPDQATFLLVLERIREIVPFNSAMLMFFDREEALYKTEAAIGDDFDPAKFFRPDSTEKFSSWAIGLREPLLKSNDIKKSRLSKSAVGSALAIPLQIEDQPVAVLCLAHSDKNFFRDRDIKLLTMLVHQIAVSRQRSLYQHELEERNKDLEKSQKLLRLAQQRLINDERLMAVRELSVSINHEINNPLSVIVGNIQCLLFIEKGLNEKVVERLRRIEAEALKIAEINHRLLEIDELVSETYINDGTKIRMINIEKSSTGAKNA